MLFDGIVLQCSLHIQKERTTAAIFHLLTGKKSIQTVQDARIYQLESFYGVYPQLSKQTFDRLMQELLTQGLLTTSERPDIAIITKQAEVWLEKNKSHLPFDHFQGLKYHESGPVFFQRLLLLIQTLTNSKKSYFTFIPVVDQTSITKWVKASYKQMHPFESKVLPMLYEEMYILLNNFTDRQAEVFVDRLTGYKNYGMSMEQLAVKHEMDANDINLLLTGMTHRMLDTILKETPRFPMMSFIIKDLSINGFMTNSAQKTHQLLSKQYSINQIAQIRKLKQNTVHDHIVEIVLYDSSFPVQDYMDENIYLEIINAIKQTNSFKLKQIKEKVSENISYFQIRLTLAKTKNTLKSGD